MNPVTSQHQTERGIRRSHNLKHFAALTTVLALVIALTSVWISADPSAVSAVHETTPSVAPGGPGSDSYFDLARKDCLGTARNTTSKVWFTVADGVLSDVYFPTIDNTNVQTLQYVVTDGRSFIDLQQRNMTYTVHRLDGPASSIARSPAPPRAAGTASLPIT